MPEANVPFEMPEIVAPSIADRDYDIGDYGGVADGKTLNTKAIAAAIDECVKAGGGRVVVPEGVWLTGPIVLKSNTELHLEKGAEVRFSTNYKDYLPPVFTRWQGMECRNYSPLVYANGCSNIAITGEGVLNGQGEAWWPLNARKRPAAAKLYKAICSGTPVSDRVFGSEEYPLRPSFVQPINCSNVLISGVTVKNGPMWTVHPVYCENIVIRGIKVETEGPNTDGIVPDSCKNMIVEDCSLSTGDDCIVIKSGLDEDAWRVGRACENIVIRRCKTRRGHGGVVIGSETSGGVRNVFVHDCVFNGTERGIRLKSRRGRGGVVENVWVRNIAMDSISGEVVRINLRYGGGAVEPRTDTPPAFRNIHISNMSCKGASKVAELVGLPEKPLENVTLENISTAAESGVHCCDVQGLRVTGLDMSVKSGPALHLVDSREVKIAGVKCEGDMDAFLLVDGEKTSDVSLQGNSAPGAERDVVYGENVEQIVVEFE